MICTGVCEDRGQADTLPDLRGQQRSRLLCQAGLHHRSHTGQRAGETRLDMLSNVKAFPLTTDRGYNPQSRC